MFSFRLNSKPTKTKQRKKERKNDRKRQCLQSAHRKTL